MPRKLALLIGVSDYGEGFDPLSAPVKDVAALQRVLANPEMGHFDEVKTLTNPGLVEMRREIGTLFSTSQKDDLVLLFFSGHGVTDDDYRLYLTTKASAKDTFKFDSLEASYIQNFSDSACAKRQVIILDCCYSGAFAGGWQPKGAEVKLELERELGKEGRVVLTSSSSTQVSFQQEDGELSLYTQYLVEGIETGAADKDKDGAIRVRELHEYAKRKVQEVKPKLKPDIIVADDEGYDIVLSRVKLDAALRFRREVEKRVDHERGEILDIDQETLQVKAQRLNLPAEKVKEIIDSVLEPSRRRLRNLERYRQKYEEYAERGYPLSERVMESLRDWQQEVLGLEDNDVAGIQRQAHQRYARSEQVKEEVDNSNFLTSLTADEAAGRRPTAPPQVDTAYKFEQILPEPNTTDKQGRLEQPLTTFSFQTARITGCQKQGGFLGVGGEVVCDIRRETKTAQGFVEGLGNGATLELVQIPAGRFVMGSPAKEATYGDEKPQHAVRVPPFLIGKFVVTQAQCEAVMGTNPAVQYNADHFVAPDKPVVGVSWNDAIAFCEKLSQQTGRMYRLPSEAQWEYACRAGTETPFYFGETLTVAIANYDASQTYGSGPKGEYLKKTKAVGSFPTNAFGLFDMHGNVWEWCQDHWHGNYRGAPADGSAWIAGGDSDKRVLRGGSWFNLPIFCRSANRNRNAPGYLGYGMGFRVCVASA